MNTPSLHTRRDFTAYEQKNGLAALCRVLINSNDFLFVN